jgi:acetyltransferase
VKRTAEAMLAKVAAARPEARIEGFTVQPMIVRPAAHELIIGVKEDPQFGPVIMFGQGGTAVEVVADRAIGLPPLNMKLAHELMERTRVFRLLGGYRDRPSADLDAVAMSLIKVAQLVADHAEITELDINPLLADPGGVIALDARVRVAARAGAAIERLAIRPYPKELEEVVEVGTSRRLLIRPVVPEDEPSFQRAFAKLTPEEVRLRFFIPMKTLTHVAAARFTQIDYDREMALVLTERGVPGRTEIYGVVQIAADPDLERAEYAIIVRADMTGMGLGVFLMRRIIDYARQHGIKEIFGDVLRDNATMLKLCDALGFSRAAIEGEPDLVRVSLAISEAT